MDADGTTYFVAKSTSYVNWLILRGFLVDGKPDAADAMFEGGVKVYPLAAAADPPAMQFISGSGSDLEHHPPQHLRVLCELDAVIQREPVGMLDPELRGLFAAIGIQKGKTFAPDARMQKILTEAVAIANATARSIVFRPRLDGAYLYPGSAWTTAFVGGSYQWLADDGRGGRNLDARTLFFYAATVNTPAMVLKMIGKGSQYAFIAIDANGDYLDGGKTYRLRIPADVPAQDFWSVVRQRPADALRAADEAAVPQQEQQAGRTCANPDGSVDLYFGPEAPEGMEANWIETVPGKGWFAVLRLYGPWSPGSTRAGVPARSSRSAEAAGSVAETAEWRTAMYSETSQTKPGLKIDIPSVPNLRDIGGYAVAGGGRVRMGQLYRSTDLHHLQGNDVAAMASLRIRTIFDLRTEAERSAEPDVLPPGAELVVCDVLAGEKDAVPAALLTLPSDPAVVREMLGDGKAAVLFEKAYRDVVSLPSALTAYRAFFEAIARDECRPALFHCTTGKDRTGWAAATTLLLLGVSGEDVMSDYLLTNRDLLPSLEPVYQRFRAAGGDPHLLDPVLGVDEAYLQTALDELTARFGSIEAYFTEGLGIDGETQLAIKRALIEPQAD